MNISPWKKSLLRVLYPAIIFVGLVLLPSASAQAQQWATADNNSQNIKNTNTGDVGVGTGSPNYKLDIANLVDKAQIRFGLGALDSGGYMFSNAPSHAVFSGGASWDGAWKAKSMNASSLQLNMGSLMFFSDTNLTTNGTFTPTERMRIASSGYIGIGTTTPLQKLQIGTNTAVASSTPDTLSLGATYSSTAGTNAKLRLWDDNAGNVYGLGVSSAQFDFMIPSAARYVWSFSGVEKMRLDNTGTVGIGTSTPNSLYKLDVNGQIHTTGGIVFLDGTTQTTAGGGGGGTITGVTAGLGLTGGGTSGSLTLNVGAGTGVSVAADTISVTYGSTAGTAVEGNKPLTILAGAGMSVTGGGIILGAGGTVTLDNTAPIFKNIKNSSGVIQFSAQNPTDSISFQGTGGTTVSFATGNKVIIDSASTITAANVSAGQFGSGNYTFQGNVTVNGTLEGTNIKAKYQDVAEWVESSEALPKATVVVLDTTKSNHVVASTQPYDSRIAGVISSGPGIALGEQTESRVLVATTGRVKVKVDASNGPIQIGDLLVTSDKPGLAMKSIPVEVGGVRIHRPGTLIGKALEPLEKGTGEILVLLSLQ